jgi:hypothetical protein
LSGCGCGETNKEGQGRDDMHLSPMLMLPYMCPRTSIDMSVVKMCVSGAGTKNELIICTSEILRNKLVKASGIAQGGGDKSGSACLEPHVHPRPHSHYFYFCTSRASKVVGLSGEAALVA